MFFFRVELSSFDDEKSVLYIIPDALDVDEKGIPVFSEKALTAHTTYKQFVKETKTSVVDVRYVLFKTSAPIDDIDDEKFSELNMENALEQIDTNEFPITSGKTQKTSKDNDNFKIYLIIGGVVLFVIVILIAAIIKNKSTGEIVDSDSSEIYSEISEISDEPSDSSEESLPEPETSESTGYIDSKPDENSIDDIPQSTNDSGYTDIGYSGGYNKYDNTQSEYTISFHANGGEGTLESIISAPDQYVVLPSADEASKFLSRKGYRLIGFSDNVEINYPLYDYKMPYRDVTLYAVWVAEEYTVSYNSNGGTGQLSDIKVKYGDDVPLPTEISIYKDDLNLTGWHTDKSSTTALDALKMPAENITLYAIWSSTKPTVKVTFHYDDNVMVMDVEKGTLNMRQDFGITKDGYTISGWYLENSQQPLEFLEVTEDCHVYGKWERATYITISIDQSYLNSTALTYSLPLDMNGEATFITPIVNDRSSANHIFGCTYGFSSAKQNGDYGKIEYYGGTEYKFKKDTTLYRVLNKYGGGSGTENDPYIIDYYDQLMYLAENDAVGCFIQTSDIEFPSNADRKPINTVKISRGYENKFYDLFVYDGQNYTIKNLRGEGGLFGTIAASTIKNVCVDGAKISVTETDGGILCNAVASYNFDNNGSGRDTYATGNSIIHNCHIIKSSIYAEKALNVGVIVGSGGIIENCLSEANAISGSAATMGGIVGNACTVEGCISSGNVIENGKMIGGIAGTAFGTEIYESGMLRKIGGDITGCSVVSFTCKNGQYCGGIVGQTSGITYGYIRSCYVANINLNGTQNGGISGGDSDNPQPHIIAYCIVDSSNGYNAVGGSSPRSKAARMVLSVPEDGLKVDGILAVLNAAGSGFTEWKISRDINNGYPYTKAIGGLNDIR